jgi:sugar phosphate permease
MSIKARNCRILYITALVVAGEMVFSLPFHTARFFRPTLLEVFGFTNTQLGDLFAVYGATAMLSYFPGGPLADRFPARTLIAASLAATAAGGLYMATFPGALQMAVLYGFWGVTTIFLLWGALIRATREWGGHTSQGVAFGVLDAGRGLVAALVAVLAVAVLAAWLPADATLASDAERRAGLRMVILLYSAATLAAGLFAWLVIPPPPRAHRPWRNPMAGVLQVLRRPVIWAQAGVIICAYCCYKALDNYSLYGVEVLGLDEVQAAGLTSYGAYARPVAALAAGIIADRFDASRALGVTFLLLLLVYALLATLTPTTAGLLPIYGSLLVSMFAVFALRGIYFALLEETRTPRNVTGAAVGAISFVGFTPEIFFASIAGRILDADPGIGGHLDYFRFLGAIAAAGTVIVVTLLWLKRRGNEPGAQDC